MRLALVTAFVCVVVSGCGSAPNALGPDMAQLAASDFATASSDLVAQSDALFAPDGSVPFDNLSAASQDLAFASVDLPSFVHKPYIPAMSANWADVRALHGSAGSLYATGSLGSFSTKTQGASYEPFPLSFSESIHTVWSSPSRVVFGGQLGLCIVPITGGTCARFGDVDGGNYAIFGLAAAGDDVYAVGGKGSLAISRNAGESFAWAQAPGSVDVVYRSVYADSHVVLIGHSAEGAITRSTNAGVDWQTISLATTEISSLWGTGTGHVWAVGCDYWGGDPICFASIFHSEDHGATWTKQAGLTEDVPELPLIPAQLLSVWGGGANDVWAVGYDGTIVHSTDLGATWPVVPSPTKQDFFAIWGTGPSDFWIGGTNGCITTSDDSASRYVKMICAPTLRS